MFRGSFGVALFCVFFSGCGSGGPNSKLIQPGAVHPITIQAEKGDVQSFAVGKFLIIQIGHEKGRLYAGYNYRNATDQSLNIEYAVHFLDHEQKEILMCGIGTNQNKMLGAANSFICGTDSVGVECSPKQVGQIHFIKVDYSEKGL